MKLEIFQIDAFTDKLFGGNPAAVIPLHKWLETGLMQKIALENNLSETVFFIPSENKASHFEIQIGRASCRERVCYPVYI